MNTKSFATYPILSFPITTLLLTLFFIFLLYIPRLLYLYLRTRIFRFWKRNMAKRISHFEALDLARSAQGLEEGEMNGNRDGKDTKRKSKRRWDWDLEKGEAEAKEEEENEWVTKGEMAKEWVCEGEEKREGRRLGLVGNGRRVAEETRWLHCVGRDGGEGEEGREFGGGDREDENEKKREKEVWCEIRMDKEIGVCVQ
ncbi:uncharacterized protein Bfra_011507 [Botrytis fragariae]|uniref:Uncharacterized protein n=1 Tax=Botrytis fragariae TaxID=1964551 RepID=A0A8H6EKN8_9HELO|nr:uncharacterized protein Bfra_011507 [Botrytis fragariae]KAF5875744.1 hypothetical protein Bfra_011507 [Botrytis fragariae]